MRRASVLGIALLLCQLYAPRSARAGDGDPTGLDLVERCHALTLLDEGEARNADEETLRNYGYCLGYLVGFVSGFAARDASGVKGRFCPPDRAQIADFVAAVRAWLVKNPDGLESPGAVVTLKALQAAFPCSDEELRGREQ